ncbi:hypothetical protein PASE110613_17670 [Paenibacillus sediminis]|uniref:Uncharacterized protein n=1 Tax=Paenibacillus sediminis TaxID=664909 RepID=A0ABS4H240_9BACL|nr:hypothetical protein [Paenibacillus sediminis]
MKFKIYNQISKDKIKSVVPKPYHGKLLLNLREEIYSIIIFSGSKDQVFISSIVRRANLPLDNNSSCQAGIGTITAKLWPMPGTHVKKPFRSSDRKGFHKVCRFGSV